MELILINEKKLKIMLSPEDMREYALTCESVNYANTETRRAFWSILDEAKHRTGFDAASERVYIQLYPSREGGCEMYITKIGLLGASPEDKNENLHFADERELAYSFDGLDLLLRVCRQLEASGFGGGSEAYAGVDGRCYLYIGGVRGCGIPERLAFISEFGTEEDAALLRGFTGEHCRVLCKNDAIKQLGALA